MIKERLDPYYLPDQVKQALAPLLQKEIEKMQAWDEDQRGLALELAEGRYDLDMVSHIPGRCNILADILSRFCQPG